MDVAGRRRRLQAQHADAHLAHRALDLPPGRRRGERHLFVSTADNEDEPRVCRAGNDFLHSAEARNRSAVDRQDEVARLEPGSLAGAAGNQGPNARREDRAAVEGENARENRNRQDEIGEWTGEDDGRSLPDRLSGEGHRTLGLRHVCDAFGVRHARAIRIAMKLDVTAERDCRNAPARAVTIDPREKLRSEADRERVHLHAAPAADKEMAKLVDEDDNAENDYEGDDVEPKSRQ